MNAKLAHNFVSSQCQIFPDQRRQCDDITTRAVISPAIQTHSHQALEFDEKSNMSLEFHLVEETRGIRPPDQRLQHNHSLLITVELCSSQEPSNATLDCDK